MENIIILCLSYLLGSFPSGYIAGRLVANLDLREVGSGSTGATNVLRHVGKWPALSVFLIDISKGICAVLIAKSFGLNDLFEVCCGLLAVFGHIWPIWLNGKGGKAVATGLGIFLGFSWPAALISLGVFIIVLLISRMVSLSSLIASMSLPFLMFYGVGNGSFSLAYFIVSLITMAAVIWRHRSNVRRILLGKEPKIWSSK